MLSKYKVLGTILLVLAAIVTVFKVLENTYDQGVAYGTQATEKSYLERLEAQRLLYDEELSDLQTTVSDLESKVAIEVATLDSDYINKLEKRNEEMESTLAGVRNGTIRLYDHGVSSTTKASETSKDNVTETSCRSNEVTGGELSKETSRVLVQLTGEADGVTEQLLACQSLVKTYLNVIDQYNQSLALGTRTGLQGTGKQD